MNMRRLLAGTAMTLAMVMTGVADAAASNLVALTGDRTLLTIDSSPAVVRRVNVSVQGQLLGIDFRPADGKLYGLLASGPRQESRSSRPCPRVSVTASTSTRRSTGCASSRAAAPVR